MRRQDELIALYPSQNATVRKFLLTQMEDLGLAFDSEDLLAFLRREIAGDEPMVRQQAALSLVQFLPAYTRKRYALTGPSLGVWTSFNQDPSEVDVQALAPPPPEEAARILEAAYISTMPVAGALCAVTDSAVGWSRTASVVAVTRFALREVKDWLRQQVESQTADHQIGLALARMEGSDAETPVLDLVRRRAPHDPDYFSLLREIESESSHALILDSIDRTDSLGRTNLARCLSGFRDIDHIEAVDRLLAHEEPWVVVACLGALEAVGKASFLPRIVQIYKGTRHEFLRAQVVRSIGGIRCPESITLCLSALKSGSEPVRAVALESLVRLQADPDLLKRVAVSFLKSPHIKTRINAFLAVSSPQETLKTKVFISTLLSEDPLDRLEAAYCLGYLQSRRALEILGALTRKDPSEAVRIQAIKSLSKYSARFSAPALLPLLGHENRALALASSRVLMRYESEEAGMVCEVLKQGVEGLGPQEKALRYWTIGALAGKSGYPHATEVLEAGFVEEEPAVQLGVVEGWNLLGRACEGEARTFLERMTRSPAPRIRARAHLAMWNGGDVDVPDRLVEMIISDEVEEIRQGVESAMEMGLLIESVPAAGRFEALARSLMSVSQQPGFEEEVAEEVQIREVVAIRETAEEDVGFGVRRDLKAESWSDRSAGAGPTDDSGISERGLDVGKLEAFLDHPRLRESEAAGRIEQGLQKFSYLAGGSANAQVQLSRVWESPRGKAALTLPLALYVVLSWMFLTSSDVRSVLLPMGFPGDLWVAYSSREDAPGSVTGLEVDRAIEPGEVVSCPEKALVVLCDRYGDRILFQGRAGLTFRGRSEETGAPYMEFRQPTGSLIMDFRSAAHARLEMGKSVIEFTGVLRVDGTGVELVSGVGTLQREGFRASALPWRAKIGVRP